MTEYYLVNGQEYFAAGFVISNGQVYVNTTTGLDTAAFAKADDALIAKAALYQQVQQTAATFSEQSSLTPEQEAQLTAKLDAQFKVVRTEDLMSC